MIICSRSGKNKKTKTYFLWWRSNFPNWKSIIKYKMPTRINKKTNYKNKTGLPRFFWVMLTDSKGLPIPTEEIEKLTIFECSTKIDLLEYLAGENFPEEIINLFTSKL